MSMQEIFMNGGGALLVLLTLVQIAPIKVNPWSALAKWSGRAINADMLKHPYHLIKQAGGGSSV